MTAPSREPRGTEPDGVAPFRNPPGAPPAPTEPAHRGKDRSEAAFWAAAAGTGAVLGAILVAYGLARIAAIETAAFDFAFFEQLLWNTAQGRPYHSTFVPYPFLAQHVEVAFLALVPLYQLGAGPAAMVGFQAAGVGLSAVVLAGAGRALTGSRAVALLSAAAFACSPFLHRAATFDFHPELMAGVPVFGSAWAAATGRWRLSAALGASALLIKEDQAFNLLALAVVVWWLSEGRARGPALALAGLGAAWAAGVVLVFQPWLRDGAPSDLAQRYGYLGESAPAIVATLVSQPAVALTHLWQSGAATAQAVAVLATAPAALLAPWWLLLPAPHLLLAGLSQHQPQPVLGLHYGAAMLPALVLAQLLALRRLPRRGRLAAAAAALVVSAAVSLTGGPLRPDAWPQCDPDRQRALAETVNTVPPGVPVSAQSNLAVAFARRERLHEFPGPWERRAPARGDPQWVVLDEQGHVSTQARAAGFDALRARLSDWGFRPVHRAAGIVVYHCAACPWGNDLPPGR